MKKFAGTCLELETREIILKSRIGYVQYSYQEKSGQKAFRVISMRYGKLTRVGILYVIEPDGKCKIALDNHKINTRF